MNRADLRGAYLGTTDLTGANMRGARLQEADFSGGSMRFADLGGADLLDADLRRADLQGANLTRTRLMGAALRGANLLDADLGRAHVGGYKLWSVGVVHLGNTPNGNALMFPTYRGWVVQLGDKWRGSLVELRDFAEAAGGDRPHLEAVLREAELEASDRPDTIRRLAIRWGPRCMTGLLPHTRPV